MAIIQKLTDFEPVITFLNDNFSSPTHWPDWNLTLSSHYNSDFYYLGLYDNDELIGICPVHETRKGLKGYLNSGNFFRNPYGGWIMSKEMEIDFPNIPVRFNQSLSGFTLPLLDKFKTKYPEKLSREYLTLIIDLTKSYDLIFMEDFESRVRNTIRKAIKNNITIEVANDIDQFYFYYYNSCIKRSQRPQPKDFFTDLFTKCENIKFEISWAVHNEKNVGLDVICYDKDYSFGFWNYGFPDAPGYGQGTLIIAEAIRRSRLYGCTFFDFGFAEKERLLSIYQFKKGFTQTEVPIIHFSYKPITFKMINRLTRITLGN